jgi:hypothetical protein
LNPGSIPSLIADNYIALSSGTVFSDTLHYVYKNVIGDSIQIIYDGALKVSDDSIESFQMESNRIYVNSWN